MIYLRGGYRAYDHRLGRVPSFDDRSRQFPLRSVLPSAPLRSRTWPLPIRLDQSLSEVDESACTGYSRCYDLAATPAPLKNVDYYELADQLYVLARQNDEWAGSDYQGSSLLGALKGAQLLGYIGEYRWAFGIDDVIEALSKLGPVVVGTWWTEPMLLPRPSGLVHTAGGIEGGHAYIARGVILSGKIKGEKKIDEPLIRFTNSWGNGWGVNGDFYMRASALEKLLKDEGEAAVTLTPFKR